MKSFEVDLHNFNKSFIGKKIPLCHFKHGRLSIKGLFWSLCQFGCGPEDKWIK